MNYREAKERAKVLKAVIAKSAKAIGAVQPIEKAHEPGNPAAPSQQAPREDENVIKVWDGKPPTEASPKFALCPVHTDGNLGTMQKRTGTKYPGTYFYSHMVGEKWCNGKGVKG